MPTTMCFSVRVCVCVCMCVCVREWVSEGGRERKGGKKVEEECDGEGDVLNW